MISIREINDASQLEPYAAAWQALLTQTPRATFFHSLDWLRVYWRHYGGPQKLRVLIVLDDEQPIGILPLVVRRESTKVGSLRVLTYPLDSWGSFYGPIGPDPARTLAEGLKHIRSTRRDWDILELRAMHPQEVRDYAASFADNGLPFEPATMEQTAMVRLDGNWSDYLAGRTSKWRNNYKRWQRRLAERGAVRYVRYRPLGEAHGQADPRWDLYDACVEIASRSWQAVDNDTPGTTISHPAVQGFLRDTHEAAARVGAVDLNLLLLDEKPLAFAYNYHYRGAVYGLRIGYDASLAKDGAGNLLYAKAIENSFEMGDQVYDFGPGSLSAKEQLLSEVVPIYQASYYAPTALRAQLVRLKRSLAARKGDGGPTVPLLTDLGISNASVSAPSAR